MEKRERGRVQKFVKETLTLIAIQVSFKLIKTKKGILIPRKNNEQNLSVLIGENNYKLAKHLSGKLTKKTFKSLRRAN